MDINSQRSSEIESTEEHPRAPAGATDEVDVVIVGAGPSGLYAAIYAGFRGMSSLVVDALPVPGGQITALFPEKYVYDVAGLPRIRGRELVDALLDQARPFGVNIATSTTVSTVTQHSEGLLVCLSDGRTIFCRAVIIAAGLGEFRPRPLPGDDRFRGRGLSYHVTDPAQFVGQRVAIFGGGDSAVDWALALAPHAAETHLIHRRDTFRAHAHTVSLLQPAGVRLHLNRRLDTIEGSRAIETVNVVSTAGQAPLAIACDRVIGALGFQSNLGPVAHWGLRLDNRRIVVDATMATSVPRVFAIGDVAVYPGKVRLLSVGFGEAATAVNNAAPLVRTGLDAEPGHSSDLLLPGSKALAER